MKKLTILALAAAAILSVSCYPTRIVTVAPEASVGYSTTVYNPNHTATQVYASDYDLCLHLDLQAVGAAFAQASTVREFETILNNSSYLISNLDLNRDGYIDYLRVVETVDHFAHIFVIQAVLGRNVFQDVATLIVENPSRAGCYVEIIGAPYLYGQKYVVRPIYRTRPLIYAHLTMRGYTPWVSPWYWDYYPNYYKRPVPLHLSHYQAYVNTFMHNHRYCREILYPTYVHYTNYVTVVAPIQRNDYSTLHPEQSFTYRVANDPGANSAVRRAQNARDIQNATVSRAGTSTSTGTASRAQSAGTTGRTQAGNASTGTTSRAQSAGTTSRTQSATSAGTTSRTQAGNASTGTASRSQAAGTTGSNPTATRSGSSTTTTTRSSAGQTTVDSRVNSQGATRTRTTTGSSDASASRSSASSRSSSTGTATRSSASSSSAGTSSRSSASTGSSSSTSTRSGSSSSTATRSGSTGTATRGRN